VFESGSYTQAAKLCHMSPSAVSKSISKLEHDLKIKLFNRTTRDIRPTLQGNLYYQAAKKSLTELETLEQQLRQTNSDISGLLTINVPFDYGKMYLQPVLSSFALKHPSIQIELQFNDKYVDPAIDDADLFIRTGPLAESNIIGRKVSPMDFLICASPDYLRDKQVPVLQKNLSSYAWIRFRLKQTGKLVPIMLPTQTGYDLLNPGAQYITDYGYIVAEMCADGLGITQMPHFLAKKWLDSGAIIPLFPAHCPQSYGVYVLYPDRNHLSVRARTFLNFFIEAVNQMGEFPEKTWCQTLSIYNKKQQFTDLWA